MWSCCRCVGSRLPLHPSPHTPSPPQGAGGVITDWAGQPLRWQPEGGVAVVTPGEVLAAGDARTHAAAMKILDWPPK